jgi:hypothetical protein
MKRNIYIICFVLLGLMLTACEKTVEIDVPTERQLVLNGVPSAGHRAFVYFAHTRFFLDSSNYHPVDGTDISLTVNGTLMTPDSVSRCRYFFPYTLQEGDSLAIDITAVGGHNVHARTYVPYFPDIVGMTAANYASPSFNFHVVGFQLNDHADNNEYYSVVVNERDSGLRYNEWGDSLELVDTIHSAFFLVPNNPEVTANDVCPYIPLGGYLYSRLMFKDIHIDGQQYPMQVFIMQTVDTNERPPFKHEYTVTVESVTPARWNYTLSASSQNSMFGYFAEQGQAYGNVEGALGVFAGNAVRRYIFNPDTLSVVPTPIPLIQD